MATTLELQERRAVDFARMREIVDAAEAEDRDLTQEERNNLDEIEKALAGLDERIERQQKLERTPKAELKTAAKREGNYTDALADWLRHGTEASQESRDLIGVGTFEGRKGVNVEMRTGMWDRRALSTLSQPLGGVTVPIDQTFASRLEEAMLWYGGMTEVATTLTTGTGADLPYPTVNDTTNVGSIVEESGTISAATDPSFAAVVFKAYKYTSGIELVPWEFLQDSSVDIVGYLARALGTRIARIQNTHFTVGAGPSSPTGIMVDSVQGRAGATGTATSVTWDDLILLEHSIDKAYRNGPGVAFMFHDQTLRDIRRLKDGDGQYLWQPGIGAGAPSTISGYRYVVNNDMAVMAASANSIVFGDLSKYVIRRVRDVQIIRLDELYAANGRIGFLAWSRADGKLIDAGGNPVKHFTNSAS